MGGGIVCGAWAFGVAWSTTAAAAATTCFFACAWTWGENSVGAVERTRTRTWAWAWAWRRGGVESSAAVGWE